MNDCNFIHGPFLKQLRKLNIKLVLEVKQLPKWSKSGKGESAENGKIVTSVG